MTSRHVVVVIAVLDEAANIGELHERLRRAVLALPDTRAEFIWVVEGTDGTADLIRRLSRDGTAPISTIIEPPKRRGLGAAFRIGFAAVPASADAVLTMDADLNHQPEELSRLLDALENTGADIVIGSRHVPGASIRDLAVWRRWLSGGVNVALVRLTGSPAHDMSSGYRAYRASALRRIQFENDGFAFLPEILMGAIADGLKIVEVPIDFTARRHGQSKLYLLETAHSYLRLMARHFRRGDPA